MNFHLCNCAISVYSSLLLKTLLCNLFRFFRGGNHTDVKKQKTYVSTVRHLRKMFQWNNYCLLEMCWIWNCGSICACLHGVQRTCRLPTFVSRCPFTFCLLLVYSHALTEVREAGSSCVWDVPVIQHCPVFLFHGQLLSAFPSLNFQPFLPSLCNNSAPTTWSLSYMVLLCLLLSDYITCNRTPGLVFMGFG